MVLRDYAKVLRAAWVLIAVAVLLGAAVAGWASSRTPASYVASVRLLVSASDEAATDVGRAYTGGLLSEQRVTSYAAVIANDTVLDAVLRDTGLDLTARDLEGKLSVSVPEGTVLIDVTVQDGDAGTAQLLANSIGRQFPRFVARLQAESGRPAAAPVVVSLVQAARLPLVPVSPRPVQDVALGVLTGLALGIAAAFARKALDTAVRTSEDLGALGLTTLGVIPLERFRKGPVLLAADSRSARAEAYNQACVNLSFVNVDARLSSIVLTSAGPQEGKTTTVLNLAQALARTGARCMVVEADMRRPLVQDYLGIVGAVGLSDVLIRSVTVEDAVQRIGGDGVGFDVLPSGRIPPNASELLASDALSQLITELESRYDVVLIDAPPLLPVSDAAIIAHRVSGVLVVARAGRARRAHLAKVAEQLKAVDARVLGAVLNMTPSRSTDLYGGYDYAVRQPSRLRDVSGRLTRLGRTAA